MCTPSQRVNARTLAELVTTAEWACRELASHHADEAKRFRAERLTGPPDPYDTREFVARNRQDRMIDAADDLRDLSHGPQHYQLPWEAREQLRAALTLALAAIDGAQPPVPSRLSVVPPRRRHAWLEPWEQAPYPISEAG